MRRLVIALSLAALILAPAAVAAKGNPHRHSAFAAVAPVGVLAGEPYTITGDASDALPLGDGLIHVSKADPGCCAAFAVRPNEDGTFSYTDVANGPGTYVVTFLRLDELGNVVATGMVTFDVE